MRPGLPTSIFGLRAFCKSGGNQPISSSAPPSINMSALRNETTKLGRASTKWGSSVAFARTTMSILSSPISFASDPKSGKVATTLSLACAASGRSSSNAAMEWRSNVLVLEIRFVFIRVYSWLKFVSTVRAENEFKLKKDRIDIAGGQEKVFGKEVVIVLQTDLGKFGRIPGQVRADPRTRLSFEVVREPGIFHVQVIAANPGDPSLFESPKHLRVKSPIVKRFRDRKRFVHAAAGFKPPVHELGLPFHAG